MALNPAVPTSSKIQDPKSKIQNSDAGPMQPLLGGFSALAESAWMGFAQATEVLEPVRLAAQRVRQAVGAVGARHASPLQRERGNIFTRPLTIAEATTVLMASFFLSALLGAVRQVLFNAQFGAGSDANAFYAAIRLPDTLFSLIAGGALSNAMIPVLLSTSREDGEEAGWRLTSLVLTTLLAVFALITLVGEFLTPAFVTGLLAPGFDSPTSQLTIDLTRVMMLQPVILAVGSVATAVLNSRNRFLLTALSIASHNLALIAGIIASRIFPQFGIYGPTWGVVGGALLQAVILLPGLTEGSFRFKLSWDLNNKRLREVVRLLIPNGLAVGVGYGGFILDTAFASEAKESAALPALHNAWLLVGLPIALLGQAVGHAAFPRLAAHAAALEWSQLRGTVLRSLLAAVGLAIPALLALLILGRSAIRILFEHGKFDAAAGTLTFEVLFAYSVALPAYVATEVIARGIIALRDTRTPLVTNTFQLIGRAAIMTVLIGSMGVVAIPIAFAAAASFETIALGAVLFSKMQRAMQGGVQNAVVVESGVRE